MAQHRYIALLRGINVGRAKRIAMADLRALIAGLGFDDVRTLLNSGNVVFAAAKGGLKPPAVAARIEQALVAELGVACRVTVLAAGELDAIVADNSLLAQASDPSRLLVFTCGDSALRDKTATLAAQDWAPEALAIGRHAVYLWCPDGVLASAAGAALNKLLGEHTTARNWSTICKLQALAKG